MIKTKKTGGRCSVLLALVAIAWANSLVAQTDGRPSTQEITNAIAAGAKLDQFVMRALRTGGGFRTMGIRGGTIALYSTPLDRVRAASYSAARSYRPFTAADVTEEMVRPELHIYAAPVAIAGQPAVANVVAIVIMPHDSKDRSKVIQPLSVAETSETFRNLLGYVGGGTGLTAVFTLDVLSKNNDVHVVFDRAVRLGGDGPCTDCRAQFEVK